ncbi:MAG: hypothetical protein JNM43_10235 [Planctomycetaceae bacterium]|nr:hypothetical protein [Planctomycetaceae bacterium]
MAQTFDPLRVLRSFSMNLLREFIARHKGTPPSQMASVHRRNSGPLYEAWQSIPDDERARMQIILQKIFTLSQECGLTALMETIRERHPHRIGEFDRFEHRSDQIVWAWLNLPDVFEQAEFLAVAEAALSGRFWKRSYVDVPDDLQIDGQRIEALQDELRQVYSAQLRGRHCHIEHHQRESGVDYFCAYLDNWPDQLMLFRENGQMSPLSGHCAFTNVFSLDRHHGTLEVAARGGRVIHEQLKDSFCRAVLVKPANSSFAETPAYRLDHLLTEGFQLPTASEDRVSSVRLTHIRFAPRCVKNVRYEEIGFAQGTDLIAAEQQLRERLAERAFEPKGLRVLSVGFNLMVRPLGRLRVSPLTFSVHAPNTCNLKEKADDLRVVGERCLRMWGICNA